MFSVPLLLVMTTGCGQALAPCSSHPSRTACVLIIPSPECCLHPLLGKFQACSLMFPCQVAVGRNRHSHLCLVKVGSPPAVLVSCSSISGVLWTLLCSVRISCFGRGNVACVWGGATACPPAPELPLHLPPMDGEAHHSVPPGIRAQGLEVQLQAWTVPVTLAVACVSPGSLWLCPCFWTRVIIPAVYHYGCLEGAM